MCAAWPRPVHHGPAPLAPDAATERAPRGCWAQCAAEVRTEDTQRDVSPHLRGSEDSTLTFHASNGSGQSPLVPRCAFASWIDVNIWSRSGDGAGLTGFSSSGTFKDVQLFTGTRIHGLQQPLSTTFGLTRNAQPPERSAASNEISPLWISCGS